MASNRHNADKQLIELFDGFDKYKFPEGVIGVTAGYGSDALLIKGSEKNALIDCGNAYCAQDLIENIKRELAGETLDYVFITHSHYDHVGALPFVKQVWPNITTFGSEYTYKILQKPTAIDIINGLNQGAYETYVGPGKLEIPEGGYVIDKVVFDGDKISLGDEEITVLETKGHTNCCISFALQPQDIIFLSESTGLLIWPGFVNIEPLKSYSDALISIEKCEKYNAKYMVSPHYGLIPPQYNEKYWELLKTSNNGYLEFLFPLFDKGLSDDEILKHFEEIYWIEERTKLYPKEPFLLNSRGMIRVYRDEYESRKEAHP